MRREVLAKWETGKCLPDFGIMLGLCDLLGINVNELLSGERVMAEATTEGPKGTCWTWHGRRRRRTGSSLRWSSASILTHPDRVHVFPGQRIVLQNILLTWEDMNPVK